MINYKNKQRPEKDMIFGIRAVIEAIQAGSEIDKILVRRDMTSELSRELFSALNGLEVPVQKVPLEKLNRITLKNHQGVIAFISPVVYQHIEDIVPSIYEEGRMPFIVVLDGVTDVRNFGAIARTCECAGVDAIVVPVKGGAALNGDAVKTSAGALLKIPVCREHNLINAVRYLSSSGIKVLAASEKATQNYSDISMTEPVAIVMGAEDEGVSPEILRMCDEMMRIPMLGTIDSLNVSVAAGVLIYEAVRQRKL
ncbi:MAG: 23S rRNA (guanosine(2251)-2'-O)-methyltransferase RlmB [Paludibacter sp.]|jgi:23S rRNA (guanosine2251-2'-O)-methyltransferase|nr:23S rRNA (guanosine(2251)-2'-O)-methyltransferase RlmB [Paludibacter sp.]MDD3491140.1 23S rRNA (guanosine(2251)-2'-O)-methyltransferase RlmB [Paludibacter sp.]